MGIAKLIFESLSLMVDSEEYFKCFPMSDFDFCCNRCFWVYSGEYEVDRAPISLSCLICYLSCKRCVLSLEKLGIMFTRSEMHLLLTLWIFIGFFTHPAPSNFDCLLSKSLHVPVMSCWYMLSYMVTIKIKSVKVMESAILQFCNNSCTTLWQLFFFMHNTGRMFSTVEAGVAANEGIL